MSWIRWIGRELTRPRGRTSHRFYRSGRGSRSGVALLLAITVLMFLTVLITEISYGAAVRLKLAAHQRDEAKAEVLAYSGMQIYHLVLVGTRQVDGMLNSARSQAASMGADASMLASFGIPPVPQLWQMVPFVNTNFMRMLFVGGGDVDEEEMSEMQQEGLSEEEMAETRESKGNDRNFLDFDGDFMVEVTDEEQKININTLKGPTLADLQATVAGAQLFSLMSGRHACDAVAGRSPQGSISPEEDHDQFFYDANLDRWELVSNLADWVDADDQRIFLGGREDNLYENLKPEGYLPHNGEVQSIDELRLIDGWHRDDVWQRYGDKITVYGSGKLNINTMSCDVEWALLQAYVSQDPSTVERVMVGMREQKALLGGYWPNVAQYVSSVEAQGIQILDKSALQGALTDKSNVFRVTSTGVVNEATVTIEVIFDFSRNNLGKIIYWNIR